MNRQSVKENEFSPAPAGIGSINVQPGYGTPNYGSQNPDKFFNSNNNKALGPNSNTSKNGPDSGSMENDINAIYAKKNTPSPDSVVAGIKYELGQQIKKDKLEAKKEVLKNLKKRPDYYSGLHQLNIVDSDLITEKKLLDLYNIVKKTIDRLNS